MIKLEVMSPTQTTDIIGGNYVSLTGKLFIQGNKMSQIRYTYNAVILFSLDGKFLG